MPEMTSKRERRGSAGNNGQQSTRQKKHKKLILTKEKTPKESAVPTPSREPAGGGGGAEVFSEAAKEAMRKFAMTITMNGVHALRLQYNDLKTFVPPDPSRTAFDANPLKSRYKDVVCWDKSRVVLKWPPGVSENFVHANWVTHNLLEYQFICCQGPLDATVGDFWRCVWQEKVRQIIMLCRCMEEGKDKCAQYWPVNQGDTMSHFGLSIKNEKVDQSDTSFIHTRLRLSYGGETRYVDHRQLVVWPDKSVPKTPLAPFRLLQWTRKTPKNPSVIHCSAGIGRTGTLVAIELIYKSLFNGKVPDVPALVKDIRAMRAQAVQTEDQYVYVHYSVLQFLNVKKCAPSHFIRHFNREYELYLKLLIENGGKNLPLTQTAPPVACNRCKKIAAVFADPKTDHNKSFSDENESRRERRGTGRGKDEVTDPEAGSKRESRSKFRNRDTGSKRERKDTGSKRERKDQGSKRERKPEAVAANNDFDRKANLFKKLKNRDKIEKKNRNKTRSEAEKEDTPSHPPLPSQNQSQNQGQNSGQNQQFTLTGTSAFDSPLAMNQETRMEETPFDPCTFETKDDEAIPPALNELPSPAGGSTPPSPQEPQLAPTPPVSPPTIVAAPTSELDVDPSKAFAPAPVPMTPAAPVTPAAAPPPPPKPSTFQYKPASTYTIQQAGTKKAIVYYRNGTQPFVKAMAAPAGQPQNQILVNMQQPPS